MRNAAPSASTANVINFHAPRVRYVSPGARTARLLILATALPLVAAIALGVGSVHIGISALWNALSHPNSSSVAQTIIVQLRMPRVLLAAGVGAGLGVAGVLLQALFRNPLVDPYITGVSAGAAVAAAAAFSLGIAFAFIPALAFAGGLCSAVIVGVMSAGDSSAGNLRLVLAGVAISALASALVALILLRGGQTGNLGILAWLAGGINGRGWSDVGMMMLYLGVGCVAAFAQAHALNVMRLGSSAASGFGLRVGYARLNVLATAALITAACVAVSGIVGFVGLMVPHAMRKIVSGDARWLLPASALGGAIVVIIADLLARTIMAPTEIPLGVLLAFIGVPFFLLLARRPVEL